MKSDKKDRIQSLDILRGIAVLGILVINIQEMAYPKSQAMDYTAYSSDTNTDYWLMYISTLLASGKMRGMFSALFGITSIVIVEKLEKSHPGLFAADIYFKRLVWLLLFGLFHAFILLWSCDILYVYAICGFFLFPLRNLSPVRLIGISLLFVCILTFQNFNRYHRIKVLHDQYEVIRKKERGNIHLTEEERRVITKWNHLKESWKPDAEKSKRVIEARRGGYISNFKQSAARTRFIESKGTYRLHFFDAMVLMLLGMALYKLGLFKPDIKSHTYVLILIPSLTIGLLMHIYVYQHYFNHFYDPLLFRQGLILYPAGRVVFTLGYISLIALLCRIKIMKFIGVVLARTGKMALTNYLLQSVLAAFIFYGFGAGLFAALNRQQVFMVLLFIWIFQLVFSTIWMEYFVYGPAEWLWRSLTYQKCQPFLKKNISFIKKSL